MTLLGHVIYTGDNKKDFVLFFCTNDKHHTTTTSIYLLIFRHMMVSTWHDVCLNQECAILYCLEGRPENRVRLISNHMFCIWSWSLVHLFTIICIYLKHLWMSKKRYIKPMHYNYYLYNEITLNMCSLLSRKHGTGLNSGLHTTVFYSLHISGWKTSALSCFFFLLCTK